jgi:predicted Zn-dependent peptidase
MKFRFRIAGGVILAVLLSFLLSAQAFSFTLEGRVKEFTLQNGMKVLLLERHQSPTLSLNIRFRVGAVDENLGMTGTAHLLEHMLFKGTQTLGTKNYAAEEKLLNRIDHLGMLLDAERFKGKKGDQASIKQL